MNTSEHGDMEIDLRELFYVVKSQLLLIVLVAIFVATGSGLVSKFMITPIYEATSKLYIVNKSASLTNLSLSDLQLGSQLTKDYMVLVKSRPVTEQVIQNLQLTMTHEELLGIMNLTNPSDTRILEINVKYPDAYVAKQIVDEIANVSGKRMAVIMDMKEPSVVEEGHVALNPSGPNVKKYAVIGGVIGLFLAVGMVCLIYILDDTIKSSEDVERYLNISTIGLIPMQGTQASSNKMNIKKNKKKKRPSKLKSV